MRDNPLNPRPPYQEKPKNRPPNSISLATFLLAFFMVLFGMLIGGVAVLFSAPTLFGLSATQAYFSTESANLEARGQALAATEVELISIANNNALQATNQAFLLEATRVQQQSVGDMTQVALANEQDLLQQTATQSQQNVLATQTASALENAQQRTQVALDYASTQSALNQNATQVALNFDATRAALGGTPSKPNSSQQVAPPTPQATATRPLPMPTLAPTAWRMNDLFSNGVDTAKWYVSRVSDWTSTATGLTANQNNAWILSQENYATPYTLNLIFTPAITTDATYDMMLNVSNGNGILLRLTVFNLQLTQVAVYRFDGGLPISTLGTRLYEQKVSVKLVGNSVIMLKQQADSLQVWLNDTEIIPTTAVEIPVSGAIGVQLPQTASIASLEIIGQ